MSDEYQALPQYHPPQPQGLRMATAEEQKPIMKLLGKMLAPKLPKMKGRISPQTIKVGHKKKQQKTIPYY